MKGRCKHSIHTFLKGRIIDACSAPGGNQWATLGAAETEINQSGPGPEFGFTLDAELVGLSPLGIGAVLHHGSLKHAVGTPQILEYGAGKKNITIWVTSSSQASWSGGCFPPRWLPGWTGFEPETFKKKNYPNIAGLHSSHKILKEMRQFSPRLHVVMWRMST